MNKRKIFMLFVFQISSLLFPKEINFDIDLFLHQNLSGYETYLDLQENTNLSLFQESILYFEEKKRA